MMRSASQPYEFRNDSGLPIPPYGLILCREIVKRKADNAIFFKGELPIAADVNHLYVNGGGEVAPGGYGACYDGAIQRVAYAVDDDIGEPRVGQPWGVKPGAADDFKLHCGYGGFEVLYAPADPEDEVVIVRRMVPHILSGIIQGSDLDEPTNGWTDATTRDIDVYQPDRTDSSAPVNYAKVGSSQRDYAFAVTNRDGSASVPGGAFVRVIWDRGEWAPFWAGC